MIRPAPQHGTLLRQLLCASCFQALGSLIRATPQLKRAWSLYWRTHIAVSPLPVACLGLFNRLLLDSTDQTQGSHCIRFVPVPEPSNREAFPGLRLAEPWPCAIQREAFEPLGKVRQRWCVDFQLHPGPWQRCSIAHFQCQALLLSLAHLLLCTFTPAVKLLCPGLPHLVQTQSIGVRGLAQMGGACPLRLIGLEPVALLHDVWQASENGNRHTPQGFLCFPLKHHPTKGPSPFMGQNGDL